MYPNNEDVLYSCGIKLILYKECAELYFMLYYFLATIHCSSSCCMHISRLRVIYYKEMGTAVQNDEKNGTSVEVRKHGNSKLIIKKKIEVFPYILKNIIH